MKNVLSGHKVHETKHTRSAISGSITGKYPVVLDNGKTIIYISDKSKENETRDWYVRHELHPDVR